MLRPMRSRATFTMATLILAVCFVCQIAEIFDQWDHTLQTGNDTEYAFVVVSLCAGVACSLKWFVPGIVFPNSQAEAISYRRPRLLFFALTNCSSSILVPASPPTAALRV
jgi:hypothetical protein